MCPELENGGCRLNEDLGEVDEEEALERSKPNLCVLSGMCKASNGDTCGSLHLGMGNENKIPTPMKGVLLGIVWCLNSLSTSPNQSIGLPGCHDIKWRALESKSETWGGWGHVLISLPVAMGGATV